MDKKLLRVKKEFKVNAYDIDVMGIVSNIVYIRWFEDLRFLFLEEYYPFREILKENISPILAHTEVDYKYPVTIFDNPIGEVWIEKLETLKWVMRFRIYQDEKVFCTGLQKGYFYNLNTKRPTKIPQKLIEIYKNELKRSENGDN